MYRLAQISLASDLPLPELRRGSAQPPLCRVRMRRHGELPAARAIWARSSRGADGSVFMTTMRRADGHLFRYPAMADFHVAPDASISIYPAPRVPRRTLRHLLIDAVMPLYLAHRGALVVHASAVRTRGGAALFVGGPGRGKSTLTAALCAAGHRLIADDYVVIEEHEGTAFAVPSYPGLRLWPDVAGAVAPQGWRRSSVAHYTEKVRLDVPAHAHERRPLPIVCVYLLRETSRDGAIRIEPLAGRAALMALVRQLFCADAVDREQIASQFVRLARVAGRTPVRTLAFPRTLDALPAVCAALARDLGVVE